MHPLLFGAVPVYGLAVAAAIALGTAIAAWCLRRLGVAVESRRSVLVVLVAAGLIGLAGAKANSLFERGSVQSLAWELQHGYRYPGAILALLLGLPLLARARRLGAPLLDVGDAAATAAGFSMGIVRLGCFLAGCCHGAVSALPWAVAFPPGSPAWNAQLAGGLLLPDAAVALPVHPLQLYFALWSLALAALLLWWAPRRAYRGQVLLMWVALDNLAKAALETLREPPAPHLQWLSLAIGVAAVAALALLAARRRAGVDARLAGLPTA
jgi:phosphatidylglycerol:prolipoprotein diacylglycerol transferase